MKLKAFPHQTLKGWMGSKKKKIQTDVHCDYYTKYGENCQYMWSTKYIYELKFVGI